MIKLIIFLLMYSTMSFSQDKTKAEKIKEEKELAALPVAKIEERKDIFNLTAYNPVYFVYHPHNTKVQASFKYKVHREYNLFIGYSHLILWDLSAESDPFIDVNYNPELFYKWNINKHNIESVDWIPYGHNSNGKGDELQESRSLDYVGAQMNLKYELQKNRIFRASVRGRYFYNFDDTTSDIRKYQGPVEVKLALTEFMKGMIDKGELTARLYTGGYYGEDFSKGGQEIGLSFRILGVDITPSFYMQYFHGYSESLRFYNEKEHIFRFGLLL